MSTDHMTVEQLRAELVALNDFLGVVSGYAKIDDERVRIARGKLTALAARLSGMAADTWRQIETAPKDRRVELWIPPYYQGAAGMPTHGQWDDDKYSRRPRPFWRLDLFMPIAAMREQQPTHWRAPSQEPSHV